MLLVRREVLAPGQLPAPLPARATTPRIRATGELATLPSPWLIGTQLPPAMPARATKIAVLPAKKVSYVTKKGQVFKHQFVKWLKDDSDAWVMLVDFDADKLPKLDDLASAKLVLYVEEAHDKAPMQVAAVRLDPPFAVDQPYRICVNVKEPPSPIAAPTPLPDQVARPRKQDRQDRCRSGGSPGLPAELSLKSMVFRHIRENR
jgi:hypothetical protein